eukprot:jgi/Tetstr1/429955/TSEL_019817.t1
MVFGTVGEVSKGPQCLGKLNAFDHFASSWFIQGFAEPGKPRADPEGVHTEAKEGAGFRTTWRTVNHKRSVATGKPIVQTWLPRNVTYAGHALLMEAGEEPGSDARKLIQRMGLRSNAYIVSAKCRGVIRGMVTKIAKLMMATKALAATSHKDNHVTSGMWNIFLAMFLCEDVDLYGFSTHTVLPGTTKTNVVETYVSDGMSPYHNWGAQQAVVRYLVAARQVDLC